MNSITFVHGCLSPKYEEQANKQGYTLGKKAKEVEKMRDAINILFMHDILTESQRWNAFRRLQSKIIVPNLQKMACGESWTTIEGTPWDNDMNYCPHCGAKMEGAENGKH